MNNKQCSPSYGGGGGGRGEGGGGRREGNVPTLGYGILPQNNLFPYTDGLWTFNWYRNYILNICTCGIKYKIRDH